MDGIPRYGVLTRALALAATIGLTGAQAAPTPEDSFIRQHPPADAAWAFVAGPKAADPGRAAPRLRDYRIARASATALASVLRRAPQGAAGVPVKSAVHVRLPMPDGTLESFAVERIALLAPNVQARFPDIHTFRGRGIDDPGASARIELSPFGLRAYVLRDGDDVVIDPTGDGEHYRVFWKRDALREAFRCSVEETAPLLERIGAAAAKPKASPSGANLRTYRLAAALTGEYTTFFGNLNCPAGSPAACPTNAAMAALTTTMNRVTGLLERDTAVSFNIAATRIFTDATTDPFSDGGNVNGTLLGENQGVLDANPGSGAYDIGHVFTAGGGGGLVQGRTCDNSNKARGGTGSGNPQGDPYDVDYVAHEIGHQLSASHTWSSSAGSCSAGQFVATSAYEPGSGSTIMAYAGICGADDLQPNSDAYYHVRSIDQITDFRDNGGSGGSCGTAAGTGNTPPGVNAGPDFTIPRNTPFVLTASGSDADGQPLSFAWEQYDAAGAQVGGIPANTLTGGPLFRSFLPVASGARTLPRLSAILGVAASPWEVLPNVDRTMDFRVTARDNRGDGGGIAFDQMRVTVAGAPFAVTQPASSQQCGTGSNLAWNVGGGSIAPTVRVDYSSDDFGSSALLLASTANDGAEPYTVPRPPTTNGRIRISANGNIFFNVSPRFSIVDTLDPTVAPPPAAGAECTGPAGTPVPLGVASSSDICDLTPSLTNNAPALFPLGLTSVTWSSTDDSGNTGTATQSVNVVDTTAPVVTAPPAVTAECTSPTGTSVILGLASATDICDASLVLGNNAPGSFPLGSTVVQWFARDDSNNTGTANQVVTIVDTTPPTLSVTLSTSGMWPPNHRMVPVTAAITVSDVCDANPVVRLVSITSNEPDNGLGDGDTANDIQDATPGTDDRAFRLRSERSGAGTGRVYTVTYEARDASGNTTLASATVDVPHAR